MAGDPVWTAEPELPVFVYGTLRPGRVNWPVAEPLCARHEPARLPGFALYALEWPCAVGAAIHPDPTVVTGEVHGDLLWLDPGRARDGLGTLDRFEDYDPRAPGASLYLRERHRVTTEAGGTLDAWVYVPASALLAEVCEARRVPGDDWAG
jgi:gamma-glutamylcyclotransferase (GGCT)/AIG2-like uncharacterized protein YtfP